MTKSIKELEQLTSGALADMGEIRELIRENAPQEVFEMCLPVFQTLFNRLYALHQQLGWIGEKLKHIAIK